MAYDEKLCSEMHKTIEEKFQDHDKLLDEYTKDITVLKADGREYKTDIKNLCKEVSGLVTTMKWFIGIWVISLLGFFFYAVQKVIFK